jgi:S-adenosylmethionine:tRNA ribosyltransferase-isomerase
MGTTALRTIESAVDENGTITRFSGDTSLFIREGYRFKCANGLITNFHVPRSSLLMLVAALVGREKILKLYAAARENDFRFLSFGDGMLIL